MPNRIVAPGDCIASLAVEHGLLPATIWEHPQNAAVRRLRQDPNILFPGDVIFIPERRFREEAKPTERRHTFVRKGIPSRVRLRLLRNGKPRAHKSYSLDVDGRVSQGTTDDDGWLDQPIPPNARTGLLTLTETGERIPVFFGHLDPLEELTGIQQRLRNLGYLTGPVTGELDEGTTWALSRFQEQQELPLTGYPDDATKRALDAAHGS